MHLRKLAHGEQKIDSGGFKLATAVFVKITHAQ
jgi:hypothetical protein